MDDASLRQRFAERRATTDHDAPAFGAVLGRRAPRRRIRPVALATAMATCLIVVVLWWVREPAPVSASELMAWQPTTDALLDFDTGTTPVPDDKVEVR